MATTYTEAEIDAILLRAQRAMLIISDRIQSNFLFLYSSPIFLDLQSRQYDLYILWDVISAWLPFAPVDDDYYPLVQVLISKCQDVDAYNSTYNTLNPYYEDIGGGNIIVVGGGVISQTPLIFPGDGIITYTFPELIGQIVLTVYRGTGTTLRAHSFAPDNEFAQFNSATGAITVNYAFSAGESLWVEYNII